MNADMHPVAADLEPESDEYTDGPPIMGVVLLLGAFFLGMYVGSILWWIR